MTNSTGELFIGLFGAESAGRGRDLIVVGASEERRVAAAHLQRRFARYVRGASPAGPGLRVQELTRVVGAVAEPRTVETRVAGLVNFLCCVALHEQVDGHDTGTLQGQINAHNPNKSARTKKTTAQQEDKDHKMLQPQLYNRGITNIIVIGNNQMPLQLLFRFNLILI